jgi:hypothetical protein
MEAIRSPESLILTRSTQSHIPEDGILHSHRCENVKSYFDFPGVGDTSLLYLPEDGDGIQFRNFLFQIKARTMYNVNCIFDTTHVYYVNHVARRNALYGQSRSC